MSASGVLLLFACAKSKRGVQELLPGQRHVQELLSPQVQAVLEEGRRLAFERPGVKVYDESPLVPALERYTGGMYRVPGFKERVVEAISAGVHCLIISAAYGVVHADEVIHDYEAEIGRTQGVWRPRLPIILSDYVTRNSIGTVFVGCSKNYARVLQGADRMGAKVYKCIPDVPARQGAQRKVPKLIGEAIVSLVASKMSPDSLWKLAV